MEVPREEALAMFRRWKESHTRVGIIFAARGGTAHTAMLAEIVEVSWQIVFRTDFSVLGFSLNPARFEHHPLTILRFPQREGLTQIDGLHLWLPSGHWMFICGDPGPGEQWLESACRILEEPEQPAPNKNRQSMEPAAVRSMSTRRHSRSQQSLSPNSRSQQSCLLC